MLPLTTTLGAASLGLPAARAILVAPGSPCSTSCSNVLDSTAPDDLVCAEASYAGATGQLFQGCVLCQMRSPFHADNRSDVQSMLYNLRYAVSYCLFGRPHNQDIVNTPCITSKACGAFQDAIEYMNLSTRYTGYQYCEKWPVNDREDLEGCTECLQAAGNNYLANFVTALQAGCEQRPEPGATLGLEGNVFSSGAVAIAAPSPAASVDPAWFERGPLSLGAKVGIALGGLVALLVLLGCGIILNGKRKRKAFLRTLETKCPPQKGWPSPSAPRREDMSETPASQQPLRGWDDTPVSQRPLRGWDDSPMTASTDRAFPRYFSPYSSQYNSPVSAQDAPNRFWPHAALSPSQQVHDAGLALGGDDAAGQWTSPSSSAEGKGKAREEAYEMHAVESPQSGLSSGVVVRHGRLPQAQPPVLGHPGFGRRGNGAPAPRGLTEQDARNGDAF